MKSDIEIAREAKLQPITAIAEKLGLSCDDIVPYGKYIAKLPLKIIADYHDKKDGKLILVTAMTPTKMGAGKTTNTIGLVQALTKIGKKAIAAVREPSLGPCMGMKGGAAGGGYSQVLPMEEINLHFTGDLHAVTAAHNLLSAVVDNHLHQKNTPELHPRKVLWKRVIDMNDRSLRNIIVGLGGMGTNGMMGENGFEITAASEIMAILCLSNNLKELKKKIGEIIVGYDFLKKAIRVKDLGVNGAMTALLKDAINPNLVQTLEGAPTLIHGGPFANIAHGCNTVIATKMALKLADYTVTEAGFGADLGAEKFFDIKCRLAGLKPSAAVLVVTGRSYEIHGIENISKHVENIQSYKVPVVISINRFSTDSDELLREIKQKCEKLGVKTAITDFRESGGKGGLELAENVCEECKSSSKFKPLYDLDLPIKEKVEIIAKKIYGADGVEFAHTATKQIKQIEDFGYRNLPVCIAKTPASLTDDPDITGRPEKFTINVSSAKVSAGAGFVVIYTGAIMTMPGLPKHPSALNIDIDRDGNISGLF